MARSTVVALARYPLKSAVGERLDAVDLDHTGVPGDRSWACLDPQDGTIGSAKHPPRWGRLLEVGATRTEDGTVEVRVGDRAYVAGSRAADAALGDHLGRAVRLVDRVPDDPRLHRRLPEDGGLVPEWLADVSPGGDTVTRVSGGPRVGRFVDFGAVHLVTTGALARLGQRLATPPVAAGRFGSNLVLDAPADPEPGTELRLGDAVLRVILPTPRCVVPGLAQGDLPADRALLSALARHHRVAVPGFGRAACFGSYAEVVRPGRVHLGQLVETLPPVHAPAHLGPGLPVANPGPWPDARGPSIQARARSIALGKRAVAPPGDHEAGHAPQHPLGARPGVNDSQGG